jgi:hypothetical protein
MIEIIEILKQLIIVGFEVMLIVGILNLTAIVISAAVRALKSTEWGM